MPAAQRFIAGRRRRRQGRAQSGKVASPETAALIADVKAQLDLPEFDVFDDLLELVVQFGNVTLFASALPLAPILAFVNNLQEIRSDAYKVLHLCRRVSSSDMVRPVHGIRAWTCALQCVTVAASFTNAGLLAFTHGWLDWLPPTSRLLYFAWAQQGVLLTLLVLVAAAPRMPSDVATRVAVSIAAHERALLDMAAPLASKLKEELTAVRRLQAIARGRQARKEAQRVRTAVHCIQRAARMYLQGPGVRTGPGDGRKRADAGWQAAIAAGPSDLRRRVAWRRAAAAARTVSHFFMALAAVAAVGALPLASWAIGASGL